MLVERNREELVQAYSDIRDDATDTNWIVLKYDGNDLAVFKTGVEFEEFQNCFEDEDRAYAYLRVISGDEMSKRMKFIFITWIGSSVRPLKKAKMSTDKAFVQQLFTNYGVEMTAENKDELNEDAIKNLIEKASGANYGTGK